MTETHSNIDLSVVIPVFNEEDNLEPLMVELDDVLKKQAAVSRCFASTIAVRTTAPG